MTNPLVETVEYELKQLGMSNAKLLRESYNAQSFGNAEAVYKLGNLQLRFIRDRGQDTVDIGSSIIPEHFYTFDDVALWMEWLSFDELLRFDKPINFDEPPPGPIFSLSEALGYIKRDLAKLDRAFSADEIMSTNAKLKDIERQRIKDGV